MPLGISLHDHFNHLPSPPPMNSLAVEQIQKPNQSNDIVRATSCWNKLILDFVCSYFQRMRDVSSFTQSNGWRIPSRPVVFFFFFFVAAVVLLCFIHRDNKTHRKFILMLELLAMAYRSDTLVRCHSFVAFAANEWMVDKKASHK